MLTTNIFAILLIIVNAADSGLGGSDNLSTALVELREAELFGVDISESITRFNSAIDLLEQAENSNFKSCVSYDDCTEKANRLFELITHDSAVATYFKEQSTTYNSLTEFIFYALGAFAISFGTVFCYRSWKTRQQKAFLNMEIMKKEK